MTGGAERVAADEDVVDHEVGVFLDGSGALQERHGFGDEIRVVAVRGAVLGDPDAVDVVGGGSVDDVLNVLLEVFDVGGAVVPCFCVSDGGFEKGSEVG